MSLAATLVPIMGVSAGSPGDIYKSDMLVRRPGGPLKGNNIYDPFTLLPSQTIYGGGNAYPAGTVRWAYFYVQNDGNVFATHSLQPTNLSVFPAGFSVRYFTTSGVDITNDFLNGVATADLAPGQRAAVRVRIEILDAAAPGATLQLVIRANSIGEDDLGGLKIKAQ